MPPASSTSVTDPLGHATTYEYDAAGRVVRTIDALGGVATTEYDAVGNVVAETDPLGRRTTYGYDAAYRLIATTFPDGAVEQRSYDAADQLLTITNPAGDVRSFTYDTVGALASVTDELGHVTTFENDEVARTQVVEDANGNRTTTTYDAFGRVSETRRPGGETETTTYDAAGRLATQTNANGETWTFAYGTSGLPSTLTLPDTTQETFTWTPDGLPASITDARGTTTHQYAAATRAQVRVTEPDGRYVRYEYDLRGLRTKVAYGMIGGGSEEVTTYAYDALERLVTVTDPAGGVTTYTRDAVGQETKVVRPNGTTTDTTYDPRGRVTAVVHNAAGGAVLASFAYALDTLGNRLSELHADGSRVEYAYDAASRVTAERRFAPGGASEGEILYVYDAVGNVTSRTGILGNATFTYDVNDQLLAGDGVTYGYDAAGNQISASTGPGQTTAYEFDARGRLVHVEPPAGGGTDYTYDTNGVRVGSDSPAGTIDFLVDRKDPSGLSQVLRESDAGGATLRSYVHGSGLLGEVAGGAASYRHADGLGSTRLLTNGAGAGTDTYEYSAYGRLLDHDGASTQRYRFAGEPQDPESDLYHLRARYYDPRSGRFVSRDPAPGDPTNPASLHDYVYAHGNPVNFTDPSGRSLPTSLPELLGVIRVQWTLRAQQFLNFVKTERRVADLSGDFEQKLGAALAILALVDEVDNQDIVRRFFGGFRVRGASAGFAQSIRDALSIQNIVKATINLGRVASAMFGEKMEYQADDFINCRVGYFAVAVRQNIGGVQQRHISLCIDFWRLSPMPTTLARVFGAHTDASMAGVMVHEWTHIKLNTDDKFYLCQHVAPAGGSQAVRTADSYRCWVEWSYVGRSE